MLVDPSNAHINRSSENIPRAVMNCSLNSNKLNICSINIQSLCARQFTKFHEFQTCFLDSKLDIICLTESWLTEEIPDDLISLQGYKLVRNDRIYGRGGGICVYIKNDLNHKILSMSEHLLDAAYSNLTEYIFLEIRYQQHKFLLATIYNPPQSDCSQVLYDKFSELSLNYTDVVILGDFNTDWSKPSYKTDRLRSVTDCFGLKCVNTEPTHFFTSGCSQIDLVFTSDIQFVSNLHQVSAPAFSKHDIIFASLNISRIECNSVYMFRDYNSVDIPSLVDAIDSVNWDVFRSITDTDVAIDLFNTILSDLHDVFVPLRRCNPKRNPWFTPEIQKAMIERDIAYRLWKTDRTFHHHAQYRRLRNKVTSLINAAKSNYVDYRVSSSNSSQNLWKKLKQINSIKPSTNQEKWEHSSDEINEFFATNFSDSSNDSIFVGNDNGFCFSPVDDADTILAIKSITSDAVGLDNIPLKFIKLVLPCLVTKITFLFNLIIKTSKYPRAWKCAKIIPIRKKSRSNTLDNLRPISILPALSKVFEKILKSQIQQHIQAHDMLSRYQSGFRCGHSTTTAVLKVHDDIHASIDKRGVAFLLLIDFSKAFDKVSHAKLLRKLSSIFQFSSSAVGLVRTYLCNRTQSVFANGVYSNSVSITSGVPQGSILGPLLFSLFINDLPDVLKSCFIHLFADDVQIYFHSLDLPLHVMADLVNADLARVMRWSERNLLPINASKTKVMFISRNRVTSRLPQIHFGNDTLEYVDKINNLGFVMQNDLEWNSHVNAQCTKIYNGLRLLRLTSYKLPEQIKLKLFKSLLLPHFMYGTVFLLNASALSLDRLKIALNSCVRFVYNLNRYSHVTHLQPNLIGCRFDVFLKLRTCLTMFKIINSLTPTYLSDKLQPLQSNRNRNFLLPRFNTSHYRSTLFVQGINYWNELPSELKNLRNLSGFRHECTNLLNSID